MLKEKELRQWLIQAEQGSESAFEHIYTSTRDDVYRTVYFLLPDKDDAKDVVNEIYTQLWKSLPRYDWKQPFRFWLHGIVVRQVSNWRRKIWRMFRITDKLKRLETLELQLTEKIIEEHETQDELISSINKLSYNLRVVVILRYYHDYTFPEIASLLGLSINTVKSRNRLALDQLRRMMFQPEIVLEEKKNVF